MPVFGANSSMNYYLAIHRENLAFIQKDCAMTYGDLYLLVVRSLFLNGFFRK